LEEAPTNAEFCVRKPVLADAIEYTSELVTAAVAIGTTTRKSATASLISTKWNSAEAFANVVPNLLNLGI
jgi:hypothetical protein